MDLATSNSAFGTVSVLPGNGNGTFGTRTDLPTGNYPWNVAIADW